MYCRERDTIFLMNTFTVGEAIRFGWETFKKRPWFFVGIYAFIGVVTSGFQMSFGADENTQLTITGTFILTAIVLGVIAAVIQTLVKMGETNILLRAHDDVAVVSWRDMWMPEPFWTYLFGTIVVGLIVFVGVILLIVPGIIFALRYMFVPYLIIDRKLSIGEALKESARITLGHKWQLLVLVLAIAGINILGVLALVVGLLVSIPVSMLATVHVYRKLEHAAGEVAPVSA